jgi:hypothetical protein
MGERAAAAATAAFDGGFQLNTFADDGRFAYEVGWRVDFA